MRRKIDLIQLDKYVYVWSSYPPYRIGINSMTRNENMIFKTKKEVKKWQNALNKLAQWIKDNGE